MARVSRKQVLQHNQPIVAIEKRWDAALYVRLSVEDNGKDSDSIDNQIALLEGYLSDHTELRKVAIFIDNGFTGTNFLRPDFERMMEYVKNGRVNCIIVKDLSRLGRNYIETSNFIEKICPLYGLRFISVNDHYDTSSDKDDRQLSVSLSNIVNDYYAKDISRKSSTVLRSKMDRGEFIANYAPYGYVKDPEDKNHLIIDPVASLVVHQIFSWRAEGLSYMGINRRLNEACVPSPGQHRISLGIETNNNKKNRIILWNKHVVTDILQNPVYIGLLVQGKHSQELYSGIPFHRTEESEWRIAYNTHKAIISIELFDKVQEINESARVRSKNQVGRYAHLPKAKNFYGKKFKCACCGATMKLHRSIKKGGDKAYFTFKCPTYAEHGSLGCSDIKIQKEKLDSAVFAFLKTQIRLFVDVKQIIELMQKKPNPNNDIQRGESILHSLRRELDRKQALIKDLYFDLKSGILTLADYSHHKEILTKDVEKLKTDIQDQESASLSNNDIVVAGINKWMSIVERFLEAQELSEEMIKALVKSISISEDGSLDIEVSFMDEVRLFMLKENAG